MLVRKNVHMASVVTVETSVEDGISQSWSSRCRQLSQKILTRNLLIAIGLGQVLSLLICGTAVSSGFLQQQGVQIPTAQNFLNYALLCVIYATVLATRKGEDNLWPVLKSRGWKYFLLGAVDVEANYLIVKAYHYTTVTSVQLLDCFTIPVVLLLSWLFLRVRYKLIHILGVGTCLLGVGALVLADVLVEKYQGQSGSNKVLGDMLCLAGAALYGVSNVAQEFVVRNFNRVEFLGMLGIFGSLINGIQFAVLERNDIAKVDFTDYKIILPMLAFALCLFLVYSLMPIVMQITSATSVNLNLLSADFYALLVGLFIFKDTFHVLYIVSFGLIITGVVIYSAKPPATTIPQQGEYQDLRSPAPEADGSQNTTCVDPGDTAVLYRTNHSNGTSASPLPSSTTVPTLRAAPDAQQQNVKNSDDQKKSIPQAIQDQYSVLSDIPEDSEA